MTDIVRLALVYIHLIAFAITISAIARQDYRLLRRGFVVEELAGLKETSRIVVLGLSILIMTGIGISAVDTGLQWSVMLERPKLLAKICVVMAILGNGILLHSFGIPCLTRKSNHPRLVAGLLCLLGSVSSVSWLYASFLGIAKPLASRLQWHEFMLLYGALVALGFVGALLLLGKPLSKLVSHLPEQPEPTPDGPILIPYSSTTPWPSDLG